MKRPRRSLRGRLLVAMAAIAVGVLVVTGATTIALARRSAQRTAIAHLQQQSPQVANQLRALGRTLRSREFTGRPTTGIDRLVASVLRVTGGTLVTVNPDGTITEGGAGLVGAADAGAAAGSGSGTGAGSGLTLRQQRLNRRRQQLGLAPTTSPPTVLAPATASASQLPDGMTVSDLDAAGLMAGTRQTGKVNGLVFVAEPLKVTASGTPVLVLTEKIDSGAVSRARGFFLIGGALALATAFVVSFFLARRLTRPLAAMGVAASAIAGGDLAARVDLGAHADDELADLARTLNGMAIQLDGARSAERSFLLSVSHDLRTPLTSIRGFAEALTDGTIPASAEQQRAGEVIAAEANRLERLVADLLDLARLDARQFSLTTRSFDAAATVRTAVAAFAPPATELGIELHVDGPDALAATGDPERVAQIVANLVENALKYARARIDVRVATVGSQGAEIRVVDDGPGVDSSEVHRVFERLFVSRAVPGRSVGTGLGLAIVGELAHAMGGTATVDTSSPGGAAFVVSLPVVGVNPAAE